MAFEYELFIVHAEADESFVLEHLLPTSGLAPERVMLSSALALGAIKMTELERGVQSSRFTLVVLSPAFATDRLAELAELLATHVSGAEGRLVPLLRADCEIPARLAFRVSLDFRDPSRWAGEGQKLRTHLQQQAAAPADISCPSGPLGGDGDRSGVVAARARRADGTLRRRLLFVAAAMPLLLATSLALSTGAKRTTCRVPGLRSLCAATGIAVAPTLAEPAPRQAIRVPPDMVHFAGAKLREGIFDASQRPATCAALKPTEDCARAQDPSEVPETALDDFYLDKHEVTNRELADWLEANPGAWRRHATDPTVIETATEPSVYLVRVSQECSLAFVNGHVRPGPGSASQPVTCVTWMAARDYCRAQGKRLPTELEWELAAKGVEGRAFPWGRSMPQPDGVAFGRGGSAEPHPADVGTSNQDITPQGVRDLGGNVAEWVADSRGGSGEIATIRGGSWYSKAPCHLLGSGCKRIKVTRLSTDVGFRCARRVVRDREERSPS